MPLPKRLDLPERKHIRAAVIAAYCRRAGITGVVVFSCGNASRALRLHEHAGLRVVDIARDGRLSTTEWWTPEEIHSAFPGFLDATSGHLAPPLMAQLANAYREHLGELEEGVTYKVPTGSGETIVALSTAYPEHYFTPVYNVGTGTARDEKAPLNGLVDAIEHRRIPAERKRGPIFDE